MQTDGEVSEAVKAVYLQHDSRRRNTSCDGHRHLSGKPEHSPAWACVLQNKVYRDRPHTDTLHQPRHSSPPSETENREDKQLWSVDLGEASGPFCIFCQQQMNKATESELLASYRDTIEGCSCVAHQKLEGWLGLVITLCNIFIVIVTFAWFTGRKIWFTRLEMVSQLWVQRSHLTVIVRRLSRGKEARDIRFPPQHDLWPGSQTHIDLHGHRNARVQSSVTPTEGFWLRCLFPYSCLVFFVFKGSKCRNKTKTG